MPYSLRQSALFLGFLAISLLIHLLLLFFVPQRPFIDERTEPRPVVVEVRPPEPLPEPPPPRERELDLPVVPDQPRETPARRLGPSDQVVQRETAPRGDMPEDRRPDAPAPAETRPRPAQTAPPQAAERPKPQPRPEPARPREDAVARREAPETPAPAPPSPELPRHVPDLQSLLQLPETTVARLENEWRQKYRADVEEGDAVWLDTERDILISFFQRFRNNIYGVWNYPARSRDRGEQGTCLLRITVRRDGTIADVRLMESSGFSALDEEAMAAVRKGAPYGPLPRAYEGETLNIMAFFSYNLSRRVIY